MTTAEPRAFSADVLGAICGRGHEDPIGLTDLIHYVDSRQCAIVCHEELLRTGRLVAVRRHFYAAATPDAGPQPFSDLTAEALARRAADGRWSCAENLVHLTLRRSTRECATASTRPS